MIREKLLAGFFILLFIFSFAGCDYKEDIKKIDLSKIEEIKDFPQEPLRIKIGLIPEQDIRKMASRYEPLAEYLSKKLNLKVILIYLDNYGEVCDKFIYKQLDAAFFGSFSYALTRVKAGIEPIVRPDYQGTSTYRGLIVVKENGNIKNIADMRGKRLALVNQATYAGYLYPLYYFKERGIGKLEAYFSKIIFAESHDKAIFALLRDEADIATPKDLVYQRVIKENPDLEKKLLVLSASEPVPSNALCVSKELDPELKNKLKQVLLNLNNDPEARSVLESLGGATRFIETQDQDYRHLYNIINALGIDLNTYPYYKRPDMGFERAGYVRESK
ncbi:MAG: phosphate/phosphite/phosphonate ABC transporter substrate-binding protein [Candidatus Omnitrophica bacterium]|nr:phosphate/phosphite/phosphonate ABC transporter substrate-binding protein [Candidatus Omnitrophota bacterium]